MDKKYFTERYGKIFGTTTFKDTKKVWDSLTKEKQNELRQSLRSVKIKEFYSTHEIVGRKQTQEEKDKRSASLKEYYKTHKIVKTKEEIEKQRESLKKYYANPDNVKKQSEKIKDAYARDPTYKKRISESVKKYWGLYRQTPEGQEAIETFIKAPRGKGTSDIEKELQEYVKSITVEEVLFNDKKTLNGKELDIYVPSKKVAIEVDGLVWHCSKFKHDYKVQLSKKTDLCNEKGIRLLHFYDDEVREKLPIVKSIIASSLGVYQKKIFARKCLLKEISREEGDLFFLKNHLNGTARSQTYYGLFYDNELVQAASFGKNRFTKEKNLELIRMASLLNTQVVGGFSKIMSVIPHCESYVDLRIYNGEGYKSSGWLVKGKTKNGYYYTDFKSRYPRQMFMKSKLKEKFGDNIDLNMLEEDICKQFGYYQIYNCGSLKVEWNSTK